MAIIKHTILEETIFLKRKPRLRASLRIFLQKEGHECS